MNVALVFAGGVGSRMGKTSKPKQFLEIYGKPIIVRTLECFNNNEQIDAIVVSILSEYKDDLIKLIEQYGLKKVKWVVDGGDTGQESRHKALQELARHCPEDTVVLIHDGVRPFVDDKLIHENIKVVKQKGNAITCTKVTQTVVKGENNKIVDVIPRDNLFMAQAPQSFFLREILGLYDRAVSESEFDSIDSCTLMQRYGRSINIIPGPNTNIKVTVAEDFYVAKAFYSLLEAKQVEGIY